MRRILAMVRKDLRRRLRAPLGAVLLILFPLLFALIIGIVFGSQGESGVPTVHLLVEDRDEGVLGMMILGAFSSEQMAEIFEVEEVGEEGAERMEKGEASALLRIPEGATESIIEGEPVVFELVRNPAQGILPEIAEQSMTVIVDVLDAGSRVLRGPLDQIAPLLDSDAGPSDMTVSAIAVGVNQLMTNAGAMLFPPVITFETETASRPPPEGAAAETATGEQAAEAGDEDEGDEGEEEGMDMRALIFLMILPGISVYALFLLGDLAMRDILHEGKIGTLRRQLAGPLAARELVLAKALQTAVLATICLVLISAVGWVVLEDPVDLPGFVVLSTALILAVTGAAAVIYGAARTDQQGSTLASLLYLVLGMAGGSFFPLSQLPEIFRKIGVFSPFYWGAEGYRALIENEAGLGDILPNVGILGGLGAVLLLVGSWLLERRVRRGAAA
jgi:ABC-2 type transport system permease protein